MRRHYYFGDIAQARGYVTAQHIERALAVQNARRFGGLSHRFLGDILLEMGVLTDCQRNEILQAQSCGLRPPVAAHLSP